MKRARKGFTLVELLIVIAIIGTLAAMTSLSVGSSTAAAKATSINNSIHNIKMAAIMYMAQAGDGFTEASADQDNLESTKLIDLDRYNSNPHIQYKIVAGTETNGALTAGAYVICKFDDDTDKAAIATALAGYKDLRIDTDDYTVGSFLYHPTASTYDADGDDNEAYDAAMSY